MRAAIRIARTWQKSTFVQQILLYSDSDQVEIVNDIDWHETHVLLKAAFTLSASGPFATYEIPFGSIQRPTTRDNSWEKARFEVPAERWADLGNTQHGMSLINDSKFGYDAAGDVLRLTMLRSPTEPDPGADRGHQHFSFALYPHSGDWKEAMTIRHGYEFNYGLKAMQVEAHTGTMPKQNSFVSVTSGNVILSAMKKAEDSDSLIFHLYEWAGTAGPFDVVVPAGAARAVETNLLEQRQGADLPLHADHVSLSIHPYEIMAFRVDYSQNKQ
jgi:alpha-mannosidase